MGKVPFHVMSAMVDPLIMVYGDSLLHESGRTDDMIEIRTHKAGFDKDISLNRDTTTRQYID